MFKQTIILNRVESTIFSFCNCMTSTKEVSSFSGQSVSKVTITLDGVAPGK